MKMRNIGAYLLDACFPNVCDCCGSYMAPAESVCPACKEALGRLRADYGKWLSDRTDKKPLPWADLITVYAYEGCARTGVLHLKQGTHSFGAHLAHELADAARKQLPLQTIDFVTWVPLSAKRRRECYCGHSEYLAKRLAAELHLPAKGGLLTEQHSDDRQHRKKAAERAVFVERFAATNRRCDGATILLCDDILTTGSTMARCAHLLLEQGAKCVYAAAGLCTDRDRERSTTEKEPSEQA